MHPHVPTKSGVMMGLGETNEEIVQVLKDLREHGVNMLTLGQYLQPSRHHLPVKRYVPPAEFDELKDVAMDSASATPPAAPSCAPPTMRICKPRAKRSNDLAEREWPNQAYS